MHNGYRQGISVDPMLRSGSIIIIVVLMRMMMIMITAVLVVVVVEVYRFLDLF